MDVMSGIQGMKPTCQEEQDDQEQQYDTVADIQIPTHTRIHIPPTSTACESHAEAPTVRDGDPRDPRDPRVHG